MKSSNNTQAADHTSSFVESWTRWTNASGAMKPSVPGPSNSGADDSVQHMPKSEGTAGDGAEVGGREEGFESMRAQWPLVRYVTRTNQIDAGDDRQLALLLLGIVDQHVLALDVAVCNASAVEERQRAEDWFDDRHARRDVEALVAANTAAHEA